MKLCEESRSKVEDEVDSSPLLHHLQASTEDGSAEVAGGVPETTLEAVCPAREITVLGDDGHLILVVGDNFSEFGLNKLRASRLVTKSFKNSGSLVQLALHDKVSRGLRQPKQSSSEDQGPEELNCHRDSVGATVCSILGTVVNARGEEKADGNCKLISYDTVSSF